MKLSIDKNVPIPDQRIRWKEIIGRMEIGDSVFIPRRVGSITPAIRSYREQGYNIVLRKEDDGCRMWLIGKPKKGGK